MSVPHTVETQIQGLALPVNNLVRPLYFEDPQALEVDLGARTVNGTRISLGAWFNAAPIGWWANLLPGGEAVVRLQGLGKLVLWASKDGVRFAITRADLDGDWAFTINLTTAYDFVWPELTSGTGATLSNYEWYFTADVGGDRSSDRKVSVVVPTYGLPTEALDQVEALLPASLGDAVSRIILIDQEGSIDSLPRFKQLREQFGERFLLITQGNFGGSGGYARGMIESLQFPNELVFLLDDDAVVDPESLRRAVTLSNLATRNTIIGTGLISSERPTLLTSFAERVSSRNFHWGPADGLSTPVDLAGLSPDEWGFLSPKVAPDYTGWWGTLLPPSTVQRVGLPVPLFLKWDDAEYGLRARNHGLTSVVVPGISVWHPTWGAKGTVSSWSSWPMHRNRLTVAASQGASRGVILDSLLHQTKHVLSLQYLTAELWEEGIDQFSSGTSWLHDSLLETRPTSQAFIERRKKLFPDQILQPTASARPLPFQFLRGILGLFSKNSYLQIGSSDAIDYAWTQSLGSDGFVISRGSNIETLTRDPRRARKLLTKVAKSHFALLVQWGALKRAYQLEVPKSTTIWKDVLDLN